VEPAPALNLPRLTARVVPGESSDEEVEVLEGREASRANVLARATAANEIELHTHGLVDLDISDAAFLVFSGSEVEDSVLLASDLRPGTLRGRPGVVLGACTAARHATYGALARSLPLAFMNAGASWVMASPRPIEDAEAPLFFAGIWRHIRGGAPPAVALRDEKGSHRWDAEQSQWTRDVVTLY
jgi:CHAT domain-containing protein